MMLADVNIYVNAFRPEALDHQPCRVWLEQLLAADSAFAVSPQVLSSFVRVATNRRVFNRQVYHKRHSRSVGIF